MSWLLHEWRLLTRSRLALCALALLLLLSTLAGLGVTALSLHLMRDRGHEAAPKEETNG